MSDAVSDPNARALLGLLLAPSRIGLPLMGPPNILAERLELLRRSYLQMTADKSSGTSWRSTVCRSVARSAAPSCTSWL